MCLVKKYNLELKREFVSAHCVACLRKFGLVDMCMFSGEGRPSLLGGYVLTPETARRLGNELVASANSIGKINAEEKKDLADFHIASAYNLLKTTDSKRASKLEKMVNVKKIKTPEISYVG